MQGTNEYKDQIVTCDVGASLLSKTHQLFKVTGYRFRTYAELRNAFYYSMPGEVSTAT